MASASEVGFGVFHPKATAQTYFAQVFATIPKGTTLNSLIQLEAEQGQSKRIAAESGEDEDEGLEMLQTSTVKQSSNSGFGASTVQSSKVEAGDSVEEPSANAEEDGHEIDEEAANEALQFIQGGKEAQQAEETADGEGETEKLAPVVDAGVLGPGGEPVVVEDPYYGLFEDLNVVHRGRCRLFHQQKGFGFIEPTPLRRPAKMPLGAKFPDLYFAREDIVLSVGARGAWDDGKDKGADHRAGALHSLCVEEEIEFKVAFHNPRGQEDELYMEEGDMSGSGEKKVKAIEITGPNRGPVRAHQPANRFRGIIRHWNSSQEYGFIAPNMGGRDVFFHTSAMFWSVPRSKRVIELGFVVEYAAVRQKSNRDRDGKQVALAVTDSNFAGIDPAVIPKSTNAAIRKEQERKRRRDDDPDADNPNRSHGAGGGTMGERDRAAGGRSGGGRDALKEELIGAGEEDTYGTW